MEKEKHLRKNTQKRAESAVYTAAQLFLRRGIEDVKMTDVAEASGIGVASLYRWFGTKEGLVVQAGTLLWRDLDALFENIYKADDFHKKSGYAQIEALLGIYRTLFSEHAPFIRFVANFDDFVIREGLDAEVLSQYEKSILDFYPHFLRSFEAGLADGSVRAGLDPCAEASARRDPRRRPLRRLAGAGASAEDGACVHPHRLSLHTGRHIVWNRKELTLCAKHFILSRCLLESRLCRIFMTGPLPMCRKALPDRSRN